MCAGRFVATPVERRLERDEQDDDAPAKASACSGVTMRPAPATCQSRREAARVEQRADDDHERGSVAQPPVRMKKM